MTHFAIGWLAGSAVTFVLAMILLRKPASQPEPNLSPFIDGIKLGYYIHHKGGTKDDVNQAIMHWQANTITDFITKLEHDYPRNTQATNR
jgi:hypothetical protein